MATFQQSMRWLSRKSDRALGVLLCGLATVVVLLGRTTEPSFEGRTVTQWLDKMRYCLPDGYYAGDPEGDPAMRALKKMGASAAPVCIRHLANARELPGLHLVLMELRAWRKGGERPPDPKVSRWTCAAAALLYLGPANGGGVSSVIEAVLRAPCGRSAAVNAFFLIGTNEPSVLPSLMSGLQDTRPPVRQFCADSRSERSWGRLSMPFSWQNNRT